MESVKEKKFSIVFIIVSFFIFEMFFGLNGKWLVLGGISIRHWLFAAVLILVCIKAFGCFLQVWRIKRKEGMSGAAVIQAELATFSRFDWFLLIFLLAHGIWILWIPYKQQSINPEGGVLSASISSGLSISIMALYFPAVYLLRKGQVQWKRYRSVVKGCLVGLCIWHIGLYILERIQWEQNHTYYFMERIFIWWEQFVQGRCELPQVIMPKYTVRLIYGCNILLPVSLYFLLGQKKKGNMVWAALLITALLTTGTRALIVGVITGLLGYLFLDCILHKWNKETVKRVIGTAGVVILFAVIMDSVAFRGMNITRLAATFSVSEEVLEQGQAQVLEWTSSEYSAESEFRGTTNSNTTRILQIKYLFEKFAERPWFGHGFTLPGCDMQGLSYIASTGLAGVFLWLVFLMSLLYRVIRMERKQRGSGLPAIYLVAAILVDVMLQCMFGSLTMATAVFLFLDLEEKEQKSGVLK